jgi:hypothetical protein
MEEGVPMRSRPAGILSIVGSTVLFALLFALLLGRPTIASAAPTVAAVSFVARQADGFQNNYCCIQVGVPTGVSFTAQIADFNNPNIKGGSLLVKLIRINDSGTLSTVCQMKDSSVVGTGQGSSFHNVGKGLFICDQTFNEPLAISMRLKVLVNYTLKGQNPSTSQSNEFILQVGEFFEEQNTAGTVQGNGVKVHVRESSLNGPTFITVKKGVPFGANTGKPVVDVVDLTVDSAVFGGETQNPSQPLDLEVQTTAPEGTELVVAQAVTIDTVTFNGSTFIVGPPVSQAVPVACATVSAATIVTTSTLNGQPCGLPGITTTGTYGILEGNGSGFAAGNVTQSGLTPSAQAGVIVSNTSNDLVAVTDSLGNYTLFVDTPAGGTFTVNAFHPLRGSVGSAPGTLGAEGATVTANIALTAPSAPVNTRPGIRNGGFERAAGCAGPVTASCGLSGWVFTGNASVAQQLPTTPTTAYVAPSQLCKNIRRGGVTYQNICSPSTWAGGGTIIKPSNALPLGAPSGSTPPSPEGNWMASLSTAGAPNGSSLKQTITVPPGAKKLRIDYNYVTAEAPEWVGSAFPFNDPFNIFITPQGGTASKNKCGTPAVPPCRAGIAANGSDMVTVDNPGAMGPVAFQPIGNCGFSGDTTCAQTGWQSVEIDLSGVSTTQPLELLFTLVDQGDTQYETRVLIDNIRFQTIWVDAKIISGATRQIPATTGPFVPVTSDLVQQDVRNATEILSQAGMNVRLRQPPQPVSGLLSVNVNHQLDATSPNCFVTGSNPPVIVLGIDSAALTNKRLTPDEKTIMTTPPVPLDSTDVRVHYINEATGVSGVKAFTANHGDFCTDVVPHSTNAGTMLTKIATDFTLAHELGHDFINAVSGSTHLHAAPSGSFTVGSPATGVVQIGPAPTANQSQDIYVSDPDLEP